MSASHARELRAISWSDASPVSTALSGMRPLRFRLGAAGLLLLSFREFLRSAAGKGGKPPFGKDGPEPSAEEAQPSSIWHDPSFWMLMLH